MTARKLDWAFPSFNIFFARVSVLPTIAVWLPVNRAISFIGWEFFDGYWGKDMSYVQGFVEVPVKKSVSVFDRVRLAFFVPVLVNVANAVTRLKSRSQAQFVLTDIEGERFQWVEVVVFFFWVIGLLQKRNQMPRKELECAYSSFEHIFECLIQVYAMGCGRSL